MSENLTPEKPSILDEQIGNELVKGNVTEAVISSLKERYMHLSIKDAEDKKEVYLQVKEGRKEAKALRVLASKICKKGREDLVKMQKAWVKKEEEVTARIAEVEDYLEKQEKEFEAEVAKEKEARKRKQEEQLILRQQELTGIGVLYSGGAFILGEVSFDLAAIKESDEDIWNETIWPLYKQAYEAIEADRIEQDRIKREQEAELKRQQEELDRKRKELEEEAAEVARQRELMNKQKIESRFSQLKDVHWQFDVVCDNYNPNNNVTTQNEILGLNDHDWNIIVDHHNAYVDELKAAEAEQKRIGQERIELQNKRYAELLPIKEYGEPVEMGQLWSISDDAYMGILERKKAAFQKSEDDKANRIAEEAAKKERERIEEEQRQTEIKRKNELRKVRLTALSGYDYCHTNEDGDLAELSDDKWFVLITGVKEVYEETKRKQEEERKAEEMAKAKEKVKWANIIEQLSAIEIPKFMSGQYAKKAAILREKLEEIKAL